MSTEDIDVRASQRLERVGAVRAQHDVALAHLRGTSPGVTRRAAQKYKRRGAVARTQWPPPLS
eukprot:scaffold98103_cov29-Tisochrysis_lutea.AAC.4